jgi:hypothetical protein
MDTTQIKLEKAKLPLPFLMFGYLCVLAGLYFLFVMQWPALLIIPGVVISAVYSQKYLNLNELQFTDETKLFGKKLTQSVSKLHVPEYIVLRPVSMKSRQSVLSISRTESLALYRVNFVYPENKVRIIYTGSYKKAEEISQLCAEQFLVPFRNRAEA